MIAIDSNVLVRLLVNDDPAQGARARAAFETEEIWIAKTVLLETFWVLRSVYDFDDVAIARAPARITVRALALFVRSRACHIG